MNATRINYGSMWRAASGSAAYFLHQRLWWAKFHIRAWLVGLAVRHAARQPRNRRWANR
jgi:hypothetical protein